MLFMGIPVTILIVDDESPICQGIKSSIDWRTNTFTYAGCAYNGKSALALILEIKPDIVITDIRMPDMTGLELMQETRKRGINSEFIAISAYKDFSYVKEAMKYGAKDYLLKPFSAEELNATLIRIASDFRKRTQTNEKILRRIQSMQKKTFLRTLLEHPAVNDDSLIEESASLGMSLGKKPARVIVCELDIHNTNFLGKKGEIFSSLIPLPMVGSVEMGPTRIAFVTEITDSGKITIALQSIRRKTDIPRNLKWGLGKTVLGLRQYHSSYNSALIALSYQLYDQEKTVFDYDKLPRNPSKTSLPEEYKGTETLFQAICQNDEKTIYDQCELFFSSLFYIPQPPPGFVRGKCLFLISDIQNKLENLFNVPRGSIQSSPDIMQILDINKLKQAIINLFSTYATQTIPHILEESDAVLHFAKTYIHSHIGESPTASYIAEKVNLSPQYFTTYFKAKAGINFRDYLIKERCDIAKKLLLEHQLDVQEISQKLGYADVRSFIRVFKNVTNMTPTEFQKRRTT